MMTVSMVWHDCEFSTAYAAAVHMEAAEILLNKMCQAESYPHTHTTHKALSVSCWCEYHITLERYVPL